MHNCTVKDYAIIGMGAIVSDYAIVGVWSVIGEGCVVKNNQIIEDREVAVGVPARIAGEITDEYRNLWTRYKNIYIEFADNYLEKLQPI